MKLNFLFIGLIFLGSDVALAERRGRPQVYAPQARPAPVYSAPVYTPATITPLHSAPAPAPATAAPQSTPRTAETAPGDVPTPQLYNAISVQFERAPFTLDEYFRRNKHPFLKGMVNGDAFRDSPSYPGATMNPSNPVGAYARGQVNAALADGTVAAKADEVIALYKKVDYFSRNKNAGDELQKLLDEAKADVAKLGEKPILVFKKADAIDYMTRLKLEVLEEIAAMRAYLATHDKLPLGYTSKYLVSTQLDYDEEMGTYNYMHRIDPRSATVTNQVQVEGVRASLGSSLSTIRARQQAGY